MPGTNKSSRGSSLVESVLVLVVFLALLIGAVDLGQALFVHQTLVERARNAVRYAAVHEFDAAAIQNLVLFNSTAAPAGADSGFMGLRRDMVLVRRMDAGTNEDRIEIRIQGFRFQMLSVFIPGTATGQTIEVSVPFELVS